MTGAIAWFRRDLRLEDNRVLEAAARGASRVWPVFVADPELLRRHAAAAGRIAWSSACLQALDDAAVYRDHLIDADDLQNDGNWRWIAGIGTGSAPPFCMFNPIRQGKRFDPDGSYVRGWVPELADTGDRFIHEPRLAPDPPAAYPAPLIDHASARARLLARHSTRGPR